MAKISTYAADASPTGDDYIIIVDGTSGTNKKVLLSDLFPAVVADDQVTAAKWVNPYSFRASLSADQSITNITSTKIQFDSVRFDTSSLYDNATNYRYTATVAGIYRFGATIRYVTLADGDDAYLYLRKNGTNFAAGVTEMSGTNEASIFVDDMIDLAVNDYVEFFTYHNNGSAQSVRNGFEWSYCWGHLIHAT